LAKVRTAHTNYPEAIALYQKAVASVPDPQIVALLGDVYAQIGQLDEAKKQYELVEYIGTLARLNRTIYNRPLAIFYADHDRNLPEALGLAQKELEIRKDIYGYDALAWALYKNGRYEDALEAIKKALRLGTKEAIFYYHAGMIQARLGLEKEAAASLKRALEINPYFHLRQAEEARAMLMRKDIVEVTSGRRE
jgi:tetratricopeptide (TPR) repeat protein